MAPSIAVLGIAALMELAVIPATSTHLIPEDMAAMELANAYGIQEDDALGLMAYSKDEPIVLDQNHRLAWKPGAGWAIEVLGLEVEP